MYLEYIYYFFQNHQKIDDSQLVEVIPFNDDLMLSLKSMWICSRIRTLDILGVHILGVHSFHVEAVTLLVKLGADANI